MVRFWIYCNKILKKKIKKIKQNSKGPFLLHWLHLCLFTPRSNTTWASLSYSLCYRATLIVSTSVGRHTSFPSLSISWRNEENAASSRYLAGCDRAALCSPHRLSCFNKHAVLVACSAIGSQPDSLGVTGSWTVSQLTEGSSFSLLWHFIWSGSACCSGSPWISPLSWGR